MADLTLPVVDVMRSGFVSVNCKDMDTSEHSRTSGKLLCTVTSYETLAFGTIFSSGSFSRFSPVTDTKSVPSQAISSPEK